MLLKGLWETRARRIVDRQMLRLIKMWLRTPIEETDGRGRRRLTGGGKRRCGTPQGGVVSPTLDVFLDSRDKAPREIVIDLDATDDPLHGHQEGRFFHGYYA